MSNRNGHDFSKRLGPYEAECVNCLASSQHPAADHPCPGRDSDVARFRQALRDRHVHTFTVAHFEALGWLKSDGSGDFMSGVPAGYTITEAGMKALHRSRPRIIGG